MKKYVTEFKMGGIISYIQEWELQLEWMGEDSEGK